MLTLLLFLTPSLAFAQGQSLGSIHGTVTDQQGGVLPGTLITATPTESRPPITATANASGYYILQGLQPGEYQISADLSGFSRLVQPGVVARAGITLSVDVVMTVGNVDELVTVNRDTPLLDTLSATTAVNISGDLQRALPTSQRRNWSDALVLTPGVVSGDSTTGGLTQSYYVHGSNVGSHVLQLDGADIASATSGQTNFIALNTDLIADVQVRTGGLDASAPLGAGAVLTITAKSGTNTISGAANAIYQSEKWNSSNVPGGTSPRVRLFQPDISIGGPIARDRLWYFGAYRHTDASSGVSRTRQQLDTLSALDPQFEPFNLQTAANLFFLKTDARLSASHRMSAFVQSDFTRTDSGGAQDSLPNTNEIGGRAIAGRMSSIWSDSITSEVGLSFNDKTFETPAFDINVPYQQIFRRTVLSSGRPTGTDLVGHIGSPNTLWTDQPANKTTASLDVSYFTSRGPGAHEWKAGLFLQPRLVNDSTINYINNGFAFENLVLRDPADPSAGMTSFRRSQYPEVTPQYESTGSNFGVYIQDVWRLGRATATLGVRVDRVEYKDRLFDLTTQNSVDIGPRFGLNYAVRADGRSVARFTWSRVADKVAGAAFAGTVFATETRSFDLNLDGVFETVDVIPGSNSLNPARIFDPDLHQPYVNEMTLGYRHQLPRQTAIDIGLVRRLIKERFAMVETNAIYEDRVFKGYRNVALSDIYTLTNNRWNWPVYTALDITATSRTSRLEFIASYTRQWQRLAGTWQPNDPASFVQPNAFAVGKGIGSSSGSLTSTAQANSLSGTALSMAGQTSSPWQDHIARVGVVATAPFGLSGALSYVYQSGPWSGPVVRNLPAPDPAFGPPTLVLSNGRTVTNPLATLVRFAYPTRGEGQFHLEAMHVLNVRIAQDVSISRTRVGLSIDVFNATNNAANQGLLSGGNLLGSANYAVGQNRQVPRGVQLGARIRF